MEVVHDGFSAALASWLKNKDIKYHPGKFHEEIPADIDGKNVLFVDFTYKSKQMDQIRSRCNKLLVLDHHETGYPNTNNLSDNDKVVIMNYSGAVLSYVYFWATTNIPLFFKYIQDRDLWHNRLPDTREFSIIQYNVPFDFEAYNECLSENKIKEMITSGKPVIKHIDDTMDNAMRNACLYFTRLTNGKYYIINSLNSNVYKSDIGSKLVSAFNFIDFGIAWSYDGLSNFTHMSLRSLESRSNVAEIAEFYDGGGHAQSSGVKLKKINYIPPYMKVYKISNTNAVNLWSSIDITTTNKISKFVKLRKYILSFFSPELNNDYMHDLLMDYMRNKKINAKDL